MKEKQHITAFYLETLLLILVFIAIILVLTQVFGLGRAQSAAAKELTDAVSLAQNAAEAVSAADSAEALAALLNETDNAHAAGSRVDVGYNADLSPSGSETPHYLVTVLWEPEGRFVRCQISVARGSDPDAAIYTLNTAVTLREADA